MPAIRTFNRALDCLVRCFRVFFRLAFDKRDRPSSICNQCLLRAVSEEQHREHAREETADVSVPGDPHHAVRIIRRVPQLAGDPEETKRRGWHIERKRMKANKYKTFDFG